MRNGFNVGWASACSGLQPACSDYCFGCDSRAEARRGLKPTLQILGLFLVASFAAHAADAPSFAKDLAPIFVTNCAGCHSASVKMGKLDLGNFDELTRVVVPGTSAESRL